MLNRNEIAGLLEKWRAEGLTSEEKTRLKQALSESEYEEYILDTIDGHLEADEFKGNIGVFGKEETISYLQKVIPNKIVSPVHRVHFLRTAWFRVAVIILLFSSVGAYLWLRNPKPGLETVATQPVPVQNDVMPGGNKAVLTLADGSVITLDSAAGGTIAQQSGATIRKSTDGEIIYAFDKTTVTGSVVYNTMSTPRGGQYQLILPDGSKVWLNAESSVTFPTAFTGKTREIKMTGEAYFEIKSDKTKPFIVKTSSDEIQVLGTSFNINGYKDAPVKTSLLEGKVKVNAAILLPGQAYRNGEITSTNLDQDIAWKNGVFAFQNTEIKQVMEQLMRWYDIEVKYVGKVSKGNITGEMSRSWNLSQVITALKKLGYNTQLKGKTLLVSQ